VAFPSRREPEVAATLPDVRPGVGLYGLNDGGAFFGQPQERKPGVRAGSQGPGSVGKGGAKVRRVARIATKVSMRRTGRGSSRARARRRVRRSRRAAANRQGAAASIGVFPLLRKPVRCRAVARTTALARARASSTGGLFALASSRSFAGAGGGRTERNVQTLKIT